MADDLDHQRSGHDEEGSIQETSNQGTSVCFNVEGSVPAIVQPPSMAHKCEVMSNATSWNLQIIHC
jgi:hypothetical protein